jgi:hypothetical protein
LPGWKADADPSIRVTYPGHTACEFVSPIYQGTEGLKNLLADVEKIKALGARVNESCGLHIHVGFDKADSEKMDRLISLVSNFEKAIYAATGTKKREQGRWCGSLQRYGNAETAKAYGNSNRYHVLNIATGGKPTVEFRAFGASLNVEKISLYVRMCVGLVEQASRMHRTPEWTGRELKPTSSLRRKGDGQTQVTRLFYQLGWTKGRTDHVYRNLIGEGLPTLQTSKKELVRLAKKYDAPAPVVAPVAAPLGLPMDPAPRQRRRSRILVGYRVRVSCPESAFHDQLGVVVARRRRGWQVRFEVNSQFANFVFPARFLRVASEV